MDAAALSNPALLAVLLVLGLGLVRFRVWWAILRTLLAPLLRPVGLILIAAVAAAAAIMHFSG